MPPSPRVSVIMAAYNSAAYIAQAIESVRAQAFEDWELIVVDDASTDRTGEIAKAYAARDARIHCYRNEHNLGPGIARQRALALAQGVYAAVLDSDDIALPAWLTRRADFLDAHEDAAVVSGRRLIIDAQGRRLGISRDAAPPEVLRWQMLFGNPLGHPSSAFRVAQARAAGGYANYPCFQDWALTARLQAAGQLVQERRPSVMYRIHAASISQTVATQQAVVEPIVQRIMAETVKRETGLTIPAELAWLLFRGRQPFAATKEESGRALDFVLRALGEYLRRIPSKQRSRIAAAAMHDAANVLRCGGWGPKQGWKALRAIVTQGGVSSLGSGTNAMKGALKLLLPYHVVRAARGDEA